MKKKICVYCSYDTTFNLENFYVILLDTISENDSVIPLAFMLHEQKFQMVQEHFWHHLVTKIPNFNKEPVTSGCRQGVWNYKCNRKSTATYSNFSLLG